MLYILILFYLFFLVLYYDIGKSLNGKNMVFWSFIFLLWCVSAFSYRLGSDTINYMYEFENETKHISDWSYSYLFETSGRQPGWMIFISLVKSIIPSFVFVKIIYALVLNFSIAYFIKNNTEKSFTVLLLYVVFIYPTLNFEVIREGWAVSIFLFSTYFYIKRKWFSYYIFLCTALTFHFSVLPFFLLPIISCISNTLCKIFFGIVLCTFIFVFSSFINELIYSVVLFESFQDKALYYFTDEKFGESTFTIQNLLNYVLNIALPLFLLYKDSRYSNKLGKIADFIIAYVVIYTLTLQLPIFYRLNNYLNIVYIIAYVSFFDFSIVFQRLSLSNKKALLLLSIVFFCLLKFKAMAQPINNIPAFYRYYPYSSIFTKEINENREKIYRFLE